MKFRLIVYKKQLHYPQFQGSLLVYFLKADSCPPVSTFQKVKEPKDRGWHITSCNFHLPVKNNFKTCAAVFFYQMPVEHMKVESYCCNKVALTNFQDIAVNCFLFSERNYLLKIFTLQMFVLNQFQSVISAKLPKFYGALP